MGTDTPPVKASERTFHDTLGSSGAPALGGDHLLDRTEHTASNRVVRARKCPFQAPGYVPESTRLGYKPQQIQALPS